MPTINYFNRDYLSIKSALLDYVKIYYPDTYSDFSEASIGMMLLELNAYVGDVLAYHLDSKANELFLETAKDRKSILKLAENLGYNVKGKKGAATLLDVSIVVPTSGNTADTRYLLTVQKGLQIKSTTGQYFEVLEDIDFNNHYSNLGTKNRTIIPQYNNLNEIIGYKITKSVVAIAGKSITKSLYIDSSNIKPFLNWFIDDINVLEIRNIVDSALSIIPTSETDWTDSSITNYAWYEVDYLAQNNVFVDTSDSQTGSPKSAYWKEVPRRFITKFDENGKCNLIFGGGSRNFNLYQTYLTAGITGITLSQVLDNTALGEIPPLNRYLHLRYRTGGGIESNLPSNTLTSIVSKNISYVPLGTNAIILNDVISSLSCTNPIPAIGGSDHPTIDEIRYSAPKWYSAQERCVTIDDYISRIYSMPGKYGNIFRAYAENDMNNLKTKIYIVTLDENLKLSNTNNDLIKQNLASYLENYRILNDFIEIYDGNVIDIAIDFSIQVESGLNKREIVLNCIKQLQLFFDINKWHMNDKIYISQIIEILRNVSGVLNVANIQFKNKIGNGYSSNVLPNTTFTNMSETTNLGETNILPINNVIPSSPNSIFQIRYPEKDIVGRVI